MDANYPTVHLNFIYVNIPEFVPVSERKETDLDKGTKYVSMFSQLQQLLGIDVKRDFILNKLFPNDIITDIIDTEPEEETGIEQTPTQQQEEPTTEDDIVNLFESGLDTLISNKSKQSTLAANTRKMYKDKYRLVYNYDYSFNFN